MYNLFAAQWYTDPTSNLRNTTPYYQTKRGRLSEQESGLASDQQHVQTTHAATNGTTLKLRQTSNSIY